MARRASTYVSPTDAVVGCIKKTLDHRVLDDFIRKVDASSVLDQRKASFAAACVATQRNIRLQFGYPLRRSVSSLLHDGLEIELEGIDETSATVGPDRL